MITAPVWVTLSLIVAAYLQLTSSGPVLFRQERVGLGGAPFIMYKFRTMGRDAEKDGPSFARERDHRIIRGG